MFDNHGVVVVVLGKCCLLSSVLMLSFEKICAVSAEQICSYHQH